MKISFIIPVYNALSQIERCLTSITPYLDMGCEAVVVNDGSTDDSYRIIEELSRRQKGIKLINQDNKGQSIARNEAIRQASGEYIWCLDSDDWISPESMKNILDATNTRRHDAIVVGRVEEYGFYNKKTPDVYYNEYVSGMEFFKEASLKGIYRTQPWNMLVSRELIIKHRIFFPEGKMFEDFYWGIKVLLYAKSVLMLPVHPYHYLLANTQSLTKQIHKRDGDIVWVIDETARMLDVSGGRLTSESPSFLVLTYWFVSSAIMKKYAPLYDSHAEAKEIVDKVSENKIFKNSVRYAATHYIGLIKSGLALLFLLSTRLYCMLLSMKFSTSYTFSKR